MSEKSKKKNQETPNAFSLLKGSETPHMKQAGGKELKFQYTPHFTFILHQHNVKT